MYSVVRRSISIAQNNAFVNGLEAICIFRESEKVWLGAVFAYSYCVRCKLSPYVSLGYTLLKHHQSVSNESKK